MLPNLWPVLLFALFLQGCIDESALINDCEPVGDMQPICSFQSPEDMELLPDGKTLIVSEMEQNHGEVYGYLSLFNTDTGITQRLNHSTVSDGERWGSETCSEPPGAYLAPHGIHLSTRGDRRLQLLVVNHGEREAVEIYEVLHNEDPRRIEWRGCAEAPASAFLNDVVALPEGGFVATHMFDRPEGQVGTLSINEVVALLGFNPGYLLHWDGATFYPVEGFGGDYLNGIQVSEDGRYLFINSWAGSTVTKFDWHEREVVGETQVQNPDNSQWSSEGNLWIASHDFSIGDLRLCLAYPKQACPGLFRVVELDPDTMDSKVLLEHAGAPMGAATVVQEVGEHWYLGSFLGDRMLKVSRR